MSTATLTEAPDVTRAVEDVAYFDQQIATLPDCARKQFVTDVRAAWFAAHPAKPQRQEEQEPAPRPLDYPEKRILDFAARILQHEWTVKGELEQAIREEFGYSATRYFQRLNALIDESRALAYAPVTVNRLRAVREIKRQARRSARRLDARSAA